MSSLFVPDQIQGRNPHYVNHDREFKVATTAIEQSPGNHVVVIGGIAGVGKTATAVELAFRLRSVFPDGQLLARLSGSLDQPGTESEVLKDFLLALEVTAEQIPDRLDARRALYQRTTAGKQLLVLLDGAISAGQVRTLMPGDGQSLVVVTEARPLSALAADTPVTFLELTPLTEEAALELLGRLLGEQRLVDEPAAAAELITLCGRLPIALCVVAGLLRRPRNRTIATTVERLRDERRRLTALSSNTDLSVTVAFTAAYRQLGDSAQRCYFGLGMSPRLQQISAAALAAALDLPLYEVSESLAELAESRFIDDLGADRYLVTDLVALHAQELDTREADNRQAETERLAAFYHQRCVDAGVLLAPARPWLRALFPDLRSKGAFPDAAEACEWLEAERATLSAIIRHAHHSGDFLRVVSWCVLLWPFFERGKYTGDLLSTHQLGIEAAFSLDNPAMESLLRTQSGFAHYWLRELDEATGMFARAVELAVASGNEDVEATALEGLGIAQHACGAAETRSTLRRNLALAEKIGSRRRIALAQFHLAKAEPADEALRLLDSADAGFMAEPGDEVINRAKVNIWRGKQLYALGRHADASAVLNRGLAVMAEHGRRFDQAEALAALGDVQAAMDDRDQAARSWVEALSCYEDLGFATLAAEVRDRIAGL